MAMNEESYEKAAEAWGFSDDVGLETLKGKTVEYFLKVGEAVHRRVGVLGFTFAGANPENGLPLLRVSHPHGGEHEPLRDLVLAIHRSEAPDIEVHPHQEVARFLVRTPLTLVPRQ